MSVIEVVGLQGSHKGHPLEHRLDIWVLRLELIDGN
jgi:hypothetical protein